jgi:hypothetical protein
MGISADTFISVWRGTAWKLKLWGRGIRQLLSTSNGPVSITESLTLQVVKSAVLSGVLTDPSRRFTFARTFEGTVGQQTYNGDGFDGAAGRTLFSNEQVFQGTTSGKCQLLVSDSEGLGGGGGFGNWGGQIDFPQNLQEGDELFIRFRMYYPAGFNHYTSGAGGRVKFFRVKTVQANNSNAGLLDLYWENNTGTTTYKQIKEGSPGSWNDVGPTGNFPHLFDQWVTYNTHYIMSADPAVGLARYWRNGALMRSFNTQTLGAVDHTAPWFYLFTYWNGTVPQNQHCFVDDLVITSDRSQTVVDPVTGYPWIGE